MSAAAGPTVAMGDPQVPLARLLAILGAHGLLEGERLRSGEHLLSIGDHVDFRPDGRTALEVGREGEAILDWLAAHPPSAVTLLIGNHDISRVMELMPFDDARFAEARHLAPAATRDPEQRAAFLTRFPTIPTPEIVLRDFASFTASQQARVQRLLLSGRFRLAAAVCLANGAPALATHAGITHRELGLLGLDAERDPTVLADALNAFLDAAVDRVRSAWMAGERVPLDLAPLHLSGVSGREGGGLLYHRPANPDRPGADRSWEGQSRRRFHPRELPLGLVQVAGHTQVAKLRRELVGFDLSQAGGLEAGDLHRIRWDGREVRYGPPGELTVEPEVAELVLIDVTAHHPGLDAARVGLLALSGG